MPSAARRIAIQGPLGFASGLPLLLTGSTLTAWLATADVSLEAIGMFALVSLPYNLKWLWAPLLDRYRLPWLGRRRGWMVLFQLLLGVTIAALGAIDATTHLGALALLATAVATLSASQDVVVDAYRTDVLEDRERGKGTAAYVAGYRVAMMMAGFIALMMASVISWRAVYAIEAALMFGGAVATLLAPAPPRVSPPRTLRAAALRPLGELFRRRGAFVALLFVMLYKVGDAVAGHMVTPFLIKQLHFSLTDIAALQKLLGTAATLAGATLGGIYTDRLGVRRALLWFGAAQALANAGYVLLALSGPSYLALAAAIGIDNLFNGLGTAAFVAYLMSICHKEYSATQYAVLTSASTVLGRAMNAVSGFLIEAIGWAGFFGATIALAAPALVLWRWIPTSAATGAPPPRHAPRTRSRRAARLIALAGSLVFAAAAVAQLSASRWRHAISYLVATIVLAAYVVVTHGDDAPNDRAPRRR